MLLDAMGPPRVRLILEVLISVLFVLFLASCYCCAVFESSWFSLSMPRLRSVFVCLALLLRIAYCMHFMLLQTRCRLASQHPTEGKSEKGSGSMPCKLEGSGGSPQFVFYTEGLTSSHEGLEACREIVLKLWKFPVFK